MTSRLEKIKNRLSAATPGKYFWLCNNNLVSEISGKPSIISDALTCCPDTGFMVPLRGTPNGELFQHAPEDLALLIETVEAAKILLKKGCIQQYREKLQALLDTLEAEDE